MRIRSGHQFSISRSARALTSQMSSSTVSSDPPWHRNRSTREGNRPSSSTVFQVPVSLPPPPPDFLASSSSAGMRSSHDRRSRRNPVHAVDRTLDHGLRVDRGAHHTGERHHAVRPPRLCWDRSGRPWTEPRRGRRTVNWQTLLPVSRLLRRWWHWLGRTVRGRLEQFL